MNVRKVVRKFFRVLLWLFLILGTIIILLVGLLQLPTVQDRLTKELEKSLASQLNTELRIGRIGLDFPKMLTIEDVYLETPAGDSLFTLGKLGVDIDMLRLFKREVVIQKIKVEDVTAVVIITDSTSNIQFLLDAFISNDTSTAPAPPPATADTAAVNWAINFPNTSLTLENADIFYQDDPNGILMDGNLDAFSINTKNINLEEQIYAIDRAHIEGGNILLVLQEPTLVRDSTVTPPPLDIKLFTNSLTVERTAFKMRSDDIDLGLDLPATELVDAELFIRDSIHFRAADFSVSDGQYAMDLPAPPLPSGFDVNHLDLKNIHIRASDIQYSLDSIIATVDRIQALDKSGLELENLAGKVRYQPDLLRVEDLMAQTEKSSLQIPLITVRYNFLEPYDPQAPLDVNSDLEANIAVGDLLFFAPQLDTIDLLRKNQNQYIQVHLDANGDQQLVNIDRIFLDAPGIRLRGNARIQNILDQENLRGNFQLNELAAIPKGIIPLLPDSLLPAYIDWPEFLSMTGNVQYARNTASFRLRAVERRDSTPVNSVIAVSGQVVNPQNYPATTVDLTIDTLRATRYSALAYLPENSIPAGYRLPGFLQGSGTVKGPLDDLEVDIRLATASDRTHLAITGHIREVLNPDSLSMDLRIPNLVVDIPELEEILPDSTLPSDLNFPDFRITQGSVSGNLTDLTFNLPITTINGSGHIEGHYAADDFTINAQINGFRPEKLYTGARADSLALLGLQPLSLNMEAFGQLEPELNARLDLVITERNQGTLLKLEGTALRDTFSGQMAFLHPDLQGTATAQYIQGDSLQEVEGAIKFTRVDLERWRLSDRPLFLSGQSWFSSKGLELDNLSARLGMNDILLRSDTSTAFVDTLYAFAELHDGKNEVEVISDLLSFTLEGSFRPVLVFEEINRFIQAYWQEEINQPDPVVYGNYLNAYIEIRNPKPLTSGIIPGLIAISPMKANFIYRERQPELLVTANLPFLNYAGIKMDSLVLDTRGSEGEVQYVADWKNINLFNQVILGKTRVSGKNTEEAVSTNLQVWNEDGELRHHIRMTIDPEPDSFNLRLASEQLIDNMTWTIPANNRLLLTKNNLQAINWKLSHNDQSITINTPGSKQLVIQLNTIALAPFSRLIRSEEEIFVGVMDGVITVNDPLGELRFDAQVDVKDLSVYDKLWGKLSVDVANQNNNTYRLDIRLSEAANDVVVVGTVVPDGALDLQIDIGALQLQSLEPLSLGYLENAQGRLAGNLSIGGDFSRPSYQGEFRFIDAAVNIGILNTRFKVENEPIRFSGQTISVDNLSFFDPQNNEATLSGTVTAASFTNYEFNLYARARDFLVLNTTVEDNALYYGYLRADADVEIGGNIYQPVLEVTASPKEGSRLTYSLIQNTVPQAESRTGIVRFVEEYEWQQTIVSDSLQQINTGQSRGFELTTNLNVNPGLQFTVIIDPVTGDQFSGRGEGDIVFHQYPDGKMEMTGRIEMVEGLYDFTYQGLISRQFSIETGSSIYWQGDPMNPSLDLNISSYIQASPYPLVNEFSGSAASSLRRQQTFAVRMYLDGTLEDMKVSTDIVYPEDVPGNSGLPSIEQSLSVLRTDQSQLNTQAFGLLLFKGFVNFGDAGAPPGNAFDNSVQSGLDNVLSQQLNNLANRFIGFVELDFGMESYNTSQGGRQRDLRLSLRKRLFNNRLVISIDGVTQTGEMDEGNTLPQTYLDNLTAEFLISKSGDLRLKIFSDREMNQFTTGDVVSIGGRLAFSKDFDHFFWSSDKRPADDSQNKVPTEEDGSREGEQKIQIEKQ